MYITLNNLLINLAHHHSNYYIQNLLSCHVIKEKCDCDESDKPTLFPGLFGEMTEEEFALSCPEPECMKRISVNMVYEKFFICNLWII